MDQGHEGRPAHLHHHFDTVEQQFESDKLGMWLFLVTEILLFGGLFCAYANYRAHHPEVFIYAHKYLDKRLGGINTVVLLCSSFTMAWGVRAAQLGQRKLLVTLLALTLLGGFTFLGIKAVEYEAKWKHGLLWGARYKPHLHEDQTASASSAGEAAAGTSAPAGTESQSAPVPPAPPAAAPAGTAAAGAANQTPQPVKVGGEWVVEHSKSPPAARGPSGLAYIPEVQQPIRPEEIVDQPKNVQIFFSIYFAMTGLHGLHVIIGMIVISIMLVMSVKGRFGPEYFTPIDLTGLYWHLVDLIWIFLFPLLYLIH
jgi:cytochrome c oxidase subunit 3